MILEWQWTVAIIIIITLTSAMKVYNNKYQIYIRNRTNITFDKKLYEDHGSDWSLHNFDSFPWNIRDVSSKQKWCGSIIWSFLWETELAPNQLSLVTIDFLTWENTTCQDRNMSFVCRTRILQCRQIWKHLPFWWNIGIASTNTGTFSRS